MTHINWRRWLHRRIVNRDAANRSAKQDSTGQLHCDASMPTETQKKVRVLSQRKGQAKFIQGNFFVIKPTRCTNFTNLFCHETLHVSGSSSVRHQEFIHCTLNNGICHTSLKTAFEQDQHAWSCSTAVYKPV